MAVSAHVTTYVVLTLHQPPGTSPEEAKDAVERIYTPLVTALEARPQLRVALHLGGHLLDLMARHHEGFLLRLKTLVQAGQVEVLGGLFYGGPIALLPEGDIRGQIAMAGEFWESFIGTLPQGIFLPHQAWAPELPRLLEDTGLLFGFLPREQADMAPSAPRHALLGRLERGGLPLYTFLFDSKRSQSFAADAPEEALRALVADVAADEASQFCGAGDGFVLAAEKLAAAHGPQDGSPVWERLFDALLAADGLAVELPSKLFAEAQQAIGVTLKLTNTTSVAQLPAENHALGPAPKGGCDWSRYPSQSFAVETLYRRMLRASMRLREAIEQMEDEGREAEWSDQLATAQRHVFAAQTADVLGAFDNPALLRGREATLKAILAAERLLDALQGRTGEVVEMDEVDLDADLSLDAFVTTARQNVWVTPGQHGGVRACEVPALGINLFDAVKGQRDTLSLANAQDGGAPAPERARLATAWHLAHGTQGQATLGEGSVALAAELVLAGQTSNRTPVSVTKHITPLSDSVGLQLDYRFGKIASALQEALWVVDVPIRLGHGVHRFVDTQGAACELASTPHAVNQATQIKLQGPLGTLTVTASSAVSARIALAEDHRADGGVLVRLWTPVRAADGLKVRIAFVPDA